MGSRYSVSGLGFWGSAGLAEFGNRKRIQVFGLATPDMACRVKGFWGHRTSYKNSDIQLCSGNRCGLSVFRQGLQGCGFSVFNRLHDLGLRRLQPWFTLAQLGHARGFRVHIYTSDFGNKAIQIYDGLNISFMRTSDIKGFAMASRSTIYT